MDVIEWVSPELFSRPDARGVATHPPDMTFQAEVNFSTHDWNRMNNFARYEDSLLARIKDPQESALLRAINGSETKQHEQAARLVMADWCDERGQLRRAKWFRGTAELCVPYPRITFMRRVGVVVAGFPDWFGLMTRNRFWRDSVVVNDWFLAAGLGYGAGPIVASMLELRRVIVEMVYISTSAFDQHLNDCLIEHGIHDLQSQEAAIAALAVKWAKEVAADKVRLNERAMQMDIWGKPLPAKFKYTPIA